MSNQQHPLQRYRYCPVCGSADFLVSSVKSKQCRHCGYELFINPSAAVVAFIRNGRGELLVVERDCEPAKGTLDLPGGFTDIDETVEESVIREIKEETGLTVTAPRSISSLSARWKTSPCSMLPMMQPPVSGCRSMRSNPNGSA